MKLSAAQENRHPRPPAAHLSASGSDSDSDCDCSSDCACDCKLGKRILVHIHLAVGCCSLTRWNFELTWAFVIFSVLWPSFTMHFNFVSLGGQTSHCLALHCTALHCNGRTGMAINPLKCTCSSTSSWVLNCKSCPSTRCQIETATHPGQSCK